MNFEHLLKRRQGNGDLGMNSSNAINRQELSEIARIISQRPELGATLLAVACALTEVKYGEITIKMQAGKPVWVDCIKRERVG